MMNVRLVAPPSKLLRLTGAAGEPLLVFQCLEHRKHVVLASGRSGVLLPLHLLVDEALELVKVLGAGESWAQLQLQPEVPGEMPIRQGSVMVRSGVWGVAVTPVAYYLSWSIPGAPVTIVSLEAKGRAELAAAVLEISTGKEVAA